ncbi:MAG TPA: type VI secretion system baseplate subunit TssK [Vicinamibacterales bacterium]|jgi:type VI secretion system protein ImpJ|nr:type VI secretion system baseplate subunit TssK [Vicinamibacterales bacterium]
MSGHNRVIWSEGLFLQPQHFQQQDRYFEQYIETRVRSLVSYAWGFTEIEIERDFLKIGKIGFRRLVGVFPDGTPFRMPDDEPLPPPLDIAADARDQRLFLALPLRRAGELESARGPVTDELVRQEVREFQAASAAVAIGEPATLEVAALRTRLLLEREATEAYACIPLAHIVECRADQQVVLDEQFIPTILHLRAATRLATVTTELLGLFHQRGEALGGRVAATSRGAASELADFLMLQTINRYQPLLTHFADTGVIHPEAFFQFCVAAAGELATFTTTSKRTPKFPGYRHDRLKESFEPVIISLRESMSKVMTQVAIPIPLEPRKFGISVAIVPDKTLFSSAIFILAARADGPAEYVRQRFPTQVKIAPAEKIGDLVRQGLPGVPVVPVPVTPRQIPYHAGYAYFELDQTHELWDQLKNSGGVAIYVPGDFPGLAMEFWAIRG